MHSSLNSSRKKIKFYCYSGSSNFPILICSESAKTARVSAVWQNLWKLASFDHFLAPQTPVSFHDRWSFVLINSDPLVIGSNNMIILQLIPRSYLLAVSVLPNFFGMSIRKCWGMRLKFEIHMKSSVAKWHNVVKNVHLYFYSLIDNNGMLSRSLMETENTVCTCTHYQTKFEDETFLVKCSRFR